MLDLIVKNGLLFDGTGNPARKTDVGIKNGRIVRIFPNIRENAAEVLDAEGLWVLPGFVDIHTHYDIEAEIAPGLSESVRHGVTTVLMGNCSLSLTVGDPADLADIFLRVENIPRVLVRKWLDGAMNWKTPGEYFRHLDSLPLGPNAAALLGHSALRAKVMGLERSLKEKATEMETSAMLKLAGEAFDAGCAGLSFDMVPWHMMSGRFKGRTVPSQHAGFSEYRALADLCRRRGLVLQLSPNPQNLATLLYILAMALLPAFGRRLKLTVLAALDPTGTPGAWRVFGPILKVLNGPLGCDIRFQTLTEPFTVFSDGPLTPLFEEFPAGRALNDAETRAERRALWQTPGFRERFALEWTKGSRRTFHRNLDWMLVVRCPDEFLAGRSIAASARAAGRAPADFFMDLLEKHDEDLRWVSTGANGRLGPRLGLMKDPNILPGFTDAGAHVRNLGYYDGALALLKQAAQTGFMTMARAVSRVTGEPARWLGLDAGILAPGKRADFVLIDPKGLEEPIAPQTEINDPLLDGALRMVKRGSERAVRSVHIGGREAFYCGAPSRELGTEKLGEVLRVAPPEPDPRLRIGPGAPEHPFTEYWPVFVLKHQNPLNVALHCLGVVWFYGFLAWGAAARDARLLLALPGSQLIGLLGHLVFERTYIDRQDAVFSLRATWCLNKLFVLAVLGRYGREVRRYRAELSAFLARRPEPKIPMEVA